MFLRKKIFLFLFLIILIAVFVVAYLVPAFQGKITVRGDYYLGPIKIHIYSCLLSFAVASAFLLMRKMVDKAGVSKEHLEELIFWNVLAGLIGARIFHVLSAWTLYLSQPIMILYIWNGGLAIYGAVIGGFLATLLYVRVKKLDFWKVADLLFLGLILGQAIGRWGNFFNQEAYGFPTLLPWKMYIQLQYRLPQFLNDSFFHPVFLYESLWDLAVFFILFLILAKNRARFSGQIFATYLILYPLGRFFIESLRADITLVGGYPLNQILSLAFMAVGLIIFLRQRKILKVNSGLAKQA